MSIQTALRSLPSKPVVFIAPAIMAMVLCWYYYDIYRICTHRAGHTMVLDRALERAAGDSSPFVLEDVFPADWDTVRIFQNYQPESKSFDCPFGWHLSDDERDTIASQGDLTVLAFYKDKLLVDFADYRSSKASFSISDAPIERRGVAFAVTKKEGDGGYQVSRGQ